MADGRRQETRKKAAGKRQQGIARRQVRNRILDLDRARPRGSTGNGLGAPWPRFPNALAGLRAALRRSACLTPLGPAICSKPRKRSRIPRGCASSPLPSWVRMRVHSRRSSGTRGIASTSIDTQHEESGGLLRRGPRMSIREVRHRSIRGMERIPQNERAGGHGAACCASGTPRTRGLWKLRARSDSQNEARIRGRGTRGTGLAHHVDVETFHLSVGLVNEETA
jgi:hypothetical protein